MPFSRLGLSAALVRATRDRNYAAPTPIQSAAIPAILQGRDVLVSASTGSGKTAAFALPLLQRYEIEPREAPRPSRALIIVPTRELAAQIGESVMAYARHFEQPIRVAAVFGGVSINPQMMALRGGAEIIVATPGRLLDLVEHNALRLRTLQALVLDEADRLLDLGFADELKRVLEMLPPKYQTILCSATFPTEVLELANRLLRDPVRIDVPATATTAPDIQQRAICVDVAKRTPLLRHLIETHGWTRALVFVATKYSTEHIAEKLRRTGVSAAPFHGELSQGARTETLLDFKLGQLQVIVATDVAARGIDIKQLDAVVNYDLPRSAVDYTHRIGRTGRAGETGVAISFVSASTEAHLRLIEKRNDLRLPREVLAGFEPVETETPTAAAPAATGGIKGKRKSKKDKLREAAARSGGDEAKSGK
ncbi:MAG TPA: DEAD/DEAH box helicase [Povalibacter sp.]